MICDKCGLKGWRAYDGWHDGFEHPECGGTVTQQRSTKKGAAYYAKREKV